MKVWKKVAIVTAIIVVLVVVCLGILMGASRHYRLVMDYGDGEIEYVINRSYWAHLMCRMRYNGSIEREMVKRASGGDYAEALLDMSGDFESVISDMRTHQRSRIDSTVDFDDKAQEHFKYNVGSSGLRLTNDSFLHVARAVDSGNVARNIYEVDEAESLEDMQSRTRLISSFTTEYKTSGASRRNNIKVATEYISGSVVLPNAQFSFNNVVGERTVERGFEEAKVIVNGEYVKGVGGGVCQVSTTLYNAWVLAGGGVIYATSHSLPPHYVALSRDAMVSSYNDMILVNNGQTPLYVCGILGNDSVTFEIYGTKGDGYYDIESEVIREVPSETKYIGEVAEDDEWEEIVMSYGVPGFESRAYLVEYDEAGNEISRSLLREDKNKSEPKIINRVKK